MGPITPGLVHLKFADGTTLKDPLEHATVPFGGGGSHSPPKSEYSISPESCWRPMPLEDFVSSERPPILPTFRPRRQQVTSRC